MRLWSPYVQEGYENGVAFYGTNGYVLIGRRSWKVVERGNKELPQKTPPFSDMPHIENFLACIKDGKRPNCDIEDGHMSTTLAHLGNILYRVGRLLNFDPKTETITGDAEANALLKRKGRKGFEIPEVV
jgi:hypothetical protein